MYIYSCKAVNFSLLTRWADYMSTSRPHARKPLFAACPKRKHVKGFKRAHLHNTLCAALAIKTVSIQNCQMVTSRFADRQLKLRQRPRPQRCRVGGSTQKKSPPYLSQNGYGRDSG